MQDWLLVTTVLSLGAGACILDCPTGERRTKIRLRLGIKPGWTCMHFLGDELNRLRSGQWIHLVGLLLLSCYGLRLLKFINEELADWASFILQFSFSVFLMMTVRGFKTQML